MQRITADGTEPIKLSLGNMPTWAKGHPELMMPKSASPSPQTTPATPVFSCELCKDTGKTKPAKLQYVGEFAWCECSIGQAMKAAKEEAEAERRANKVECLLDECDIPPRYWDARLTDYAGNAAVMAGSDAMSLDDGVGLLIWGGVGTGKTRLACALLRDWIEHEERGRFITVPDLLDEIRTNYDKPAGEKSDLLAKVRETNVVVLDDLAAERATDWVREKLYQLVNARYNDQLVTIATTNLDPDQLARQIGDRTVSRLIEMCKVIKLEGPDRRVQR